MPLSSLASAPSLFRPHMASSTVIDHQPRSISPGRLSRRKIKSQTSIDAMFLSDDAEDRPTTAPHSELRDVKKSGMGRDQELDSSLQSPPSTPTTLEQGNGKDQTKKKQKKRAESLAALLGDQILEADLKSLSDSSFASSANQKRKDPQVKRVAFMDEGLEHIVELGLEDSEVPQAFSLLLSPPNVRRGERKSVHGSTDKDDEWGTTDVLTMLSDGPEKGFDRQATETETKNTSDFFAEMKQPSFNNSGIGLSSDFGEYQPSFLSGAKRTPLAGRRRSPTKVTSLLKPTQSMEMSSEPSEISYSLLQEETTDTRITSQSEILTGRSLLNSDSSKVNNVLGKAKEDKEDSFSSRIVSTPVYSDRYPLIGNQLASLKSPTRTQDIEKISKQGLDRTTPAVRDTSTLSVGLEGSKEDTKVELLSCVGDSVRNSDRNTIIGSQPASEYQRKIDQPSLDTFNEKTLEHMPPCRTEELRDSSTNKSPRSIPIQGSSEIRTPAYTRKDEDDWSKRETTFVDLLLAERNTLQYKLDLERDSFMKEKITLQTRLKDEDLRLHREIQLQSSAKEKIERERDTLVYEIKSLREENLLLKDEILRTENERLAFEKRIYEGDPSPEYNLLKTIEEEREEAQKLAAQLSSEVQLLKNSSLLTEEKIAALHKLHDQELQATKTLHRQELEAKGKQFDIEREFWSAHQTSMDTITMLLEKGDKWAIKVDALHSVFRSERELLDTDKTLWLGALDDTVTTTQATLSEWGDHCNGIRKQFDQLLSILESGGKEIRTMHQEEKARLDKEHAHLQLLEDAMVAERAQALTDLSTARERLEDMRSLCFFEKETFLTNCMQELKDISAEREAVVQMREQLLHAEAALQKQTMEHAAAMQAEAQESAKQRLDLECAKEMAADIAQEIDEARQELELQRQAFDKEIATIQTFGLQAQQKVESAIEMKGEAIQLKLDAEAIHQEIARQASGIEKQKMQVTMAQNDLLELKRRHDEERMKLAVERQQLSSTRQENGTCRGLRDSQSSIYSLFEPKSQVFDLSSWDALTRTKHSRQVTLLPTRASYVPSNSKSSLNSPWVVQNIEAQEDFLAEASKVLQHTTQSTSSLISNTIA